MDSIIPLGQNNTLAEYMMLTGADNRPPMLDKDLYDSWKSRMKLYMQNREHRRMILESVENDPLIWPTVKENGVTRTKKYVELSVAEKIQADCDMKANNIILQVLPADIYSLLINDMNIYNMKMEQFQVNTKFLNSLPPEWSKFVTDVKLVKDLHTTNFDQLHAYLEQHELHANYFAVPVFSPRDDPIACLNKAMDFLTVGRQGQNYFETGYKSNATKSGGNNASGQARVVKCYNYQSLGKARQILDEEQLAFLADPGVLDGQVVQTIIPNNAAFQTEDLDTYDSDCDVFNGKRSHGQYFQLWFDVYLRRHNKKFLIDSLLPKSML
ncbi:hypothetical protein Tco_0521097 [Tanacetum coccineum]